MEIGRRLANKEKKRLANEAKRLATSDKRLKGNNIEMELNASDMDLKIADRSKDYYNSSVLLPGDVKNGIEALKKSYRNVNDGNLTRKMFDSNT